MALKEFIERVMTRKNRVKEIDDEYRAQRTVEERQLSANERELNRYVEEDREKAISEALAAYRKQRQHEFWHGNRILGGKNIFQGHTPILKEKNLFGARSKVLRERSQLMR